MMHRPCDIPRPWRLWVRVGHNWVIHGYYPSSAEALLEAGAVCRADPKVRSFRVTEVPEVPE